MHDPRVARRASSIVAALSVALITACSGNAGSAPSAAHHNGEIRTVAPLADLGAAPMGWSPVAFRDAQISVPAGWFIENPGEVCGSHDAGRVFIAESTKLTGVGGCGPAVNVITIRASTPGTLPHSRRATVNGIGVEIASVTRGGTTTYLEAGLGVDIGATGPMARAVLKTITHSPRSVVLNSPGLAAPATWRQVTFGGLRFAVPRAWRTEREKNWGGCGFNLAPNVLVLNTARADFIPGCPAPMSTAKADAGVAGMVVGAGPKIDERLHGTGCRLQGQLRICVYPQPLTGGFPTDGGLQILTALVYLRHQQRPDLVEIGLNGSGLAAAQIFDSLATAT